MESRTAWIDFGNGYKEELLVLPLGGNLYRLEESAELAEARYHDIIEAESLSDGSLRFLRVVTPSDLKTISYILSEALFESPALSALLNKVVTIGGNWERVFGGVLLLHFPASEEAAIVHELKELINPRSH